MRYTLWSRDRLLGESDLGFVRVYEDHVTGHFWPTPIGEALMPVITGEQRALASLFAALQPDQMLKPKETYFGDEPIPDARTADADLRAASQEFENLSLELRDEAGNRIEATAIWIRDYQQTMRLFGREDWQEEEEPLDAEMQAAIDHDIALLEEWWNECASQADGFSDDDADDDEDEPWKPERESRISRYQITVEIEPGKGPLAARTGLRVRS